MKNSTASLSVSVALCTFNGEAFLPQQLDSLASQTLLPTEVIVCDDGSTDQTLTILESWAKTVPFPVRIVKNPANLGYAANFEQAMRLCTQEVIFLCDQDDVWLSHKIETMVRVLERDATLPVVYCEGEMIDETGKRLGIPRRVAGFAWMRYSIPAYLSAHVASMPQMSGCCLALRRSFLSVALPLPPQVAHDCWIYYLAAALPKCVYLGDEPLILWRLHRQNAEEPPMLWELHGETATVQKSDPVEETLRVLDLAEYHQPAMTVSYYWAAQALVAELRRRFALIPDNPNKAQTLKMFAFNDRHFPNRDRVRRSLVLFFPLFFWELLTLRYFRRRMPLRNILSDFCTGVANSFRPRALVKNLQNLRRLLRKPGK